MSMSSVADEEESSRRHHPCPCRRRDSRHRRDQHQSQVISPHLVSALTLIFQYLLQSLLLGHSMSHSPLRPTTAGPPFPAHSDPSCNDTVLSQDAWACDLSRAEFLLRHGRSCQKPDQSRQTGPSVSSQCLTLSNHSAAELCSQTSVHRQRQLSHQLTLTFCHKYSLNRLLRRDDWIATDPARCRDRIQPAIQSLLHRDRVAASLFCEFDALLSRYNCHTGYSVKWNCSQCISTYKDWICSTVLQYYENGRLLRPCRSLCERVEQRCPYFHPWYKDQYAGEPAFICIDPQIPFIPALTPVTPNGEPGNCYDVCDLVRRQQDNCETEDSESADCDQRRSSTASSSLRRETRQNMATDMTMNKTTTSKKQSPHILPMDQVADDDAEADDDMSSMEAAIQADNDDVDDELENSSTLTTESAVRRQKEDGRVRDKS